MKENEIADPSYRGTVVRLCSDGKYRWVYDLNMITNPVIFLTVFKIFFWIVLIGWLVFGFFLNIIHGDWKGFLEMGKAMLIVLAVMAVLTFLGVAIVSALYGGRYVVLFEMDDKQVSHIQVPVQAEKAKKLGILTALVGIAARKPTVAGAGMLAAGKNASTSVFKNVRNVKARRRLHLIKVNQLLDKNQVYVPDEDFDFVYEFIKSRCPQAK